ncbi:hypothetical protein ACO0QE_004490 [Hanseniaspora vineae]
MDKITTEDILYNNMSSSNKSSSSNPSDDGKSSQVNQTMKNLTIRQISQENIHQQQQQHQQMKKHQQQMLVQQQLQAKKQQQQQMLQQQLQTQKEREFHHQNMERQEVSQNNASQQPLSFFKNPFEELPAQTMERGSFDSYNKNASDYNSRGSAGSNQESLQQKMSSSSGQAQYQQQKPPPVLQQTQQHNNRQHMYHAKDKTIQQQLNPFYQPYGIDVSHFPLTNPPIFQNLMFDDSCIPTFSTDTSTATPSPNNIKLNNNEHGNSNGNNEHQVHQAQADASKPKAPAKTNTELFKEQQMQRQSSRNRYPFQRRISISNGQIGQLNENMIMVDEVYYTQPPPMPNTYFQNHPQQQQQQQQQHQQPYLSNQGDKNGPKQEQHLFGSSLDGQLHGSSQLENKTVAIKKEDSAGNPDFRFLDYNNDLQKIQSQSQLNAEMGVDFGEYGDDKLGLGSDLVNRNDAATAAVMAGMNAPSMEMLSSNESYLQHSSSKKKSGARRILPPSTEFVPGTEEWKRSRLLERNRIAATRCRQRKKLQQEQFMKEYLDLKYNNVELNNRVVMLERELAELKQKLMEIVSINRG